MCFILVLYIFTFLFFCSICIFCLLPFKIEVQAYEHYLKRTMEEKSDILVLKPKSTNLLKNTLLFIVKIVYPYICLNS